MHIHLITNPIYKNDHTSKNSVGSLKLGYSLQKVIQTPKLAGRTFLNRQLGMKVCTKLVLILELG
jgi:hypothetical protein